MAFDFLGTFTSGQYMRLEEFLELQQGDIQGRINYLQGEIRRTGVLVVTFDINTGYIESIEASPDKSLIGKLFSAYILQGGEPEKELPIRSFNDPIYLPQGSAQAMPTEFSNKRQIRESYRYDSYMSLIIHSLKEWVLESIKFKREDLEFKMKKLMDWSDQCAFEAITLGVVGDIKVEEQSEEEIDKKVPDGAQDYYMEKYAQIAQAESEDPMKKMVVLSSLTAMIEEANTEVYSGDHGSVTIEDGDVFGLTAGKIRKTMESDKDVEDDIPIVGA